MIPVHILGVHLEPQTGSMVVLLAEGNGVHRVLPIFVGALEGASIAAGLQTDELPRPMTHDLMLSVVERLGGEVAEVRVTELRDGTFHAELEVHAPQGSFNVSSRPSDSLALAARLGVPVLVDEDVFEEAAVMVQHEPEEGFTDEEIEDIVTDFRELLEEAEPGDITRIAGEDPDVDEETES